MGKQGFSKGARARILAKFDHLCVYCFERRATQVDHLIPRAKGGTKDEANGVASCMPCGSKKGSRMPNDPSWLLDLMAIRKRPGRFLLRRSPRASSCAQVGTRRGELPLVEIVAGGA